MPNISRAAALCLAIATTLIGTAVAQAPVPGERWKQTMSMEMQGTKMPMPPSTICVPVGKAAEALSNNGGGGDSQCTMTNAQQRGNSFSADMTCVSKRDGTITGRIEQVQESPTKMRGRMTMNSRQGNMVMNLESEKLGGQCDAAEMERKMNQMIAKAENDVAKEQAERCSKSAAELRRDPSQLPTYIQTFADTSPGNPLLCKGAAEKKDFCTATQSRRGFAALDSMQRRVATDKELERQMPPGSRNMMATAFGACGMGTTTTAIEAVKVRHVAAAETEGDWGFFIRYAPKARVDALGDANCTGRAFTEARSPRYASFCASWGLRKAGGAAASNQEAYPPAGTTAAGAPQGAGSSASPGAQGEPVPVQQEPVQTNKAKDALNKGTKMLKGIFGGGGN